MKRSPFRISVLIALLCGAHTMFAETKTNDNPKGTAIRVEPRTTAPAAPKPETARTDAGVSVKTDAAGATASVEQGTTVPVPAESVTAKKERIQKEKLASDEAARATEAQRNADSASALARGEGERYAARLKAYEAARSGIGRKPAPPVKKTSLAQAQLPNGKFVVIAGPDRKEFSTKAEADSFVAEIKQAEYDSPIVLDGAAHK
ncbi:MAG: hypothetical protein ABIZ04_12210 [Opitutus sp.]